MGNQAARSGVKGSVVRRALASVVAVAVAIVVGATLVGTAAWAASPAFQAELEVLAGYGDGSFTPGEPVPVRVRIDSDRLVRDELEIDVQVPGRNDPPITVPIEVSGGSNELVVAAVPTPSDADRLTIAVAVPSLGLSRQVDIAYRPDTELVGLLPDLVAQTPNPVNLPGDLGRAMFEQLDERTLATAGALDALGTIVTGSDGLDPLDGTARALVLDWLDRGGRLVVDAAPGSEVVGLPQEWQPTEWAGSGDAVWAAAGRGQVALVDGAVEAGRWNEVVAATPLVRPGALGFGAFGMEGVAQSVARDGGLRIPSVGWLGVFLAVYVVVVGPLVFLALRRLRRRSWAWLAVPLVAAVFAAGTFVVGTDLRSGAQASHGTVVHTGPAGARGTSYVALVSRSGEDGRAAFPQGWQAASLGDSVFAAPGGPVPGGGGPSMEAEPAHVQQSPDGTVGEVDLDPGGVGMVSGWGALDGSTPGLEISAQAQADGTVAGTVRNTTDHTLHEVIVIVGYQSWGGDSLGPGEEAEWSMELNPEAEADVFLNGGLAEAPWQSAAGWDGTVPDDTPVNYALWSEVMGRQTDPYPTGLAVAAGWTREWDPAVDVGRDLDQGRTAFVADTPVRALDGQLSAPAVRRDVLRVSEVEEGSLAELGRELRDSWGENLVQTVTQFRTPPSTTASNGDGLEVGFPATVFAAQVWNGRGWVALDRRDGRGNVLVDGDIDMDGFDPWAANGRTTAVLPADAVVDGAVLMRTQGMSMSSMGGGAGGGLPTLGPSP